MDVPLTLLEREPSHGYDPKRDYGEYFGRDRPLPYGQVYATLAGWAATESHRRADRARRGPDRKTYSIIPAGAADVQQ